MEQHENRIKSFKAVTCAVCEKHATTTAYCGETLCEQHGKLLLKLTDQILHEGLPELQRQRAPAL